MAPLMLLLTVIWTQVLAQDVLGQAYSGAASDLDRTSVTFALAYSGYPEQTGWISPEIVADVKGTPKPGPNPVETADEVPSAGDYYDGSMRLRGSSQCGKLVSARTCEERTGCVWCEGACLARYRECGETESFLLD